MTAFKSNIPQTILDKVGLNFHNKPNHPLQLVKAKIFDYFGKDFSKFDDLSQKVSTYDNFDSLRIDKNHPSRRLTDTYYFDENTVLRSQTSAHQVPLLRQGYRKFLVAGDVYRKDEIDRTHYPVFHQLEGVCITDTDDVEGELKTVLSGLIQHLFPNREYRFGPDSFPFTSPSFELEVRFGDRWLEVLGCGVIHPEVLANGNTSGKGWAFGLGLERLAMLWYEIPDIRYFWVEHPRFLSQFKAGHPNRFVPYTQLDSTYRDISFWIPASEINDKTWTSENDFMSLVRDVAGNYAKEVKMIDQFVHPKTGRTSRAYRLTYEEMDPDVTDPAIFTTNAQRIHNQILTTMTQQHSQWQIR